MNPSNLTVCTTVVGSILASTQYFDDMIASFIGSGHGNEGKSDNTNPGSGDELSTSIYRRIIPLALAVAPSTAVALCGSSDLYYRATSFAGEIPCTLLYGLIPPLCNIRLRTRHRRSQEAATCWKDVALQSMLVIISIVILAVSNS